MKITYERTGALQPIAHGLTDYVAEGRLLRNDEWIPCEIGYTGWYSSMNSKGQYEPNGCYLIDPTHIFVKDGMTESGNHYYAETIEL